MKKNSKLIILVIAMLVAMSTSFAVCAESVTTNTIEKSQNKSVNKNQNFKKSENQIIGKILSIDANNVVIAVAERKKMEKKEKIENSAKEQQSNDNVNQKEKFNIDDMFTLTGENKTINIISADFGKKFEKSNDTANADTTKKRTSVAKTYADYKEGDYVTIECTDATYQVAKKLQNGGFRGGMRNGKRGNFNNKKENSKN